MRAGHLILLAVTAATNVLAAQESAPASVDCKKEIRDATELNKLEQLLKACPKNRKELNAKIQPLRQEQQRLQQEQERLQAATEAAELTNLRSTGRGDRFAIPISQGQRDPLESSPGAITIGVAGDQLTIAEGSVMFGGKGLILPTLESSIYRFDGRVDLSLLPLGISNHVAIGEGPVGNRLTFAIVDGQLVYLRGRGRILAGTKETLLGQP